MSQIFLLGGLALFSPDRNLLMASGEKPTQLSLSNPASHCLLLLIQNHGQVVEREYFFQQVWLSNGAQVTNNNFYQNISLLRRAFKEFGLNEELIITVPKVGIRLSSDLDIEVRDKLPISPKIPAGSFAPARPVPVRNLSRRWAWFAAPGAMFLILLVSFLIWRSEFEPQLQRFVSLGNSGECRFYANPDVVDHNLHRQFIKQNRVNCRLYPWAYLTLYPNFQRISVLTCRRQYSQWRDNQCVTYYYLKDLPHAGA